MHAVPLGARRKCQIPETGVIDNCKPPRGHWDPNLHPLEEQQVLLLSHISSFKDLFLFSYYLCVYVHVIAHA